jgi:hypothetical protein
MKFFWMLSVTGSPTGHGTAILRTLTSPDGAAVVAVAWVVCVVAWVVSVPSSPPHAATTSARDTTSNAATRISTDFFITLSTPS